MTSELVFVGLGMSGTDGMTIEALKALKECDKIYAEFYTSKLIGADMSELESLIGKPIELLQRAQVEEEFEIIEDAKKMKVGFVTAGDTMMATTHVDLRIQAYEENIPVKIYYGVSVFVACPAALGLQPYKFGRTVTLPLYERGYRPKSPYDHILENKKRGLHTMLLLDIREPEGIYMTAHEAIEWLLDSEEEWGEGLIDEKTVVCVASKLGSPDEKIVTGYPRDLLERDVGSPLSTLVLPGNLHFMESYALVRFTGAPEEIIEDDEYATLHPDS
ncbi:MAG: diphthine synthase [Candidatus Methanomethylophilaceae archaeon]|jgi:diphthine synthase